MPCLTTFDLMYLGPRAEFHPISVWDFKYGILDLYRRFLDWIWMEGSMEVGVDRKSDL